MTVHRFAPVPEPPSIDAFIRAAVKEAVEEAWAAHGNGAPSLTVNVTEAAVELRTSKETIRRMILEGLLPTVPGIRGRNVIPRRALEAYVNETHT